MATIMAQSRSGTGKGVARKLRREGRIPAVLYGAGRPNRNLSLHVREWMALVETERTSLRTARQNLVIDRTGRVAVLMRGFQVHPVTGNPIHVDFLRFDPNKMIDVSVPVRLLEEEESPGLKEGGVLQFARRELEVHCRAGDIPNVINLSVADLKIGDAIHIQDVSLPQGVEVLSDTNFTVVAVVGIKAEEVEEEAPEAEEEEMDEDKQTDEQASS